MSASENLLVELFVEELPPKALKKLGDVFANSVYEELKSRKLLSPNSTATAFTSPRRLAVHITIVSDVAADEELTEKLMPVSIAIKDNKPTDALRKRLAKVGREPLADLWPNTQDGPDKLFIKNDDKAEAIFLSSIAKGSSLLVGLQSALEQTIESLPIPKVMSYQLVDGWTSVNFVRPAHGLVALHGADIVPIHLLGIAASDLTQGHRFEAAKHPVMIKEADSYEKQMLDEGAVIASFEKRRTEIARQLAAVAKKEDLKPIEDDALLDEVTALVERPNVLVGQFEESFLEVPQECLILTMKANQKYFPLLDAKGKLTNKFLIVSNISPSDPSAVISGNERVVRPRLADAKFFFDQDRKKPLESRVLDLDKVQYHIRLGSQGERGDRVRALAKEIGRRIGGETLAKSADTAAHLAKADLLTDMVGEFPELQGIMGRYYAQHDGHSDDIAYAIEDHYKPRFSGDELPRNMEGICVALADKLETLSGLFSIGEKPTGDKDPYALRRHALGIIRLLSEHKLSLDLNTLISLAIQVIEDTEIPKLWTQRQHQAALEASQKSEGGFKTFATGYVTRKVPQEMPEQLLSFIYDRLSINLREQGYSPQETDAVLSLRPQNLGDIAKRLAAVRVFTALPEAESLAAANKRVGNILKKAEGKIQDKVNASLLKEPAEVALNKALSTVKPQADAAFERGDYTASLQALAALKDPVDAFFDDVMVNTEDKDLRNNRLALLAQLHAAMNRVADISKLAA